MQTKQKLRVNVQYSNKKFKLFPYNTNQEKDLLLLVNFENYTLDDALEICGLSENIIQTLSRDEKIFLLLKYRSISVGDDLNLKFACSHCGTGNSNILTIGDMLVPPKENHEYIIDKFKEVTDDNIQDFLLINIDDLELDEYCKVFKEVQNSITKFNFSFPVTCQKCKKDNLINLNKGDEFIIDNMSEETLSSIYKLYNDLVFNSNYTKQDIDTMYPFERQILINLLNKTREEANK
jgi:hypothetical protein